MFTYEGDSKFSTSFGGFVSIGILSAVWVYLYTLVITMIKRDNSTFNISTEIVNLSSDTTQYKLFNDYGFAFGVSVTNYKGKSVALDDSYFTLKI